MQSRTLIYLIIACIAVWAVAAGLLGKYVHWGVGLAMAMAAILAVLILGIIDSVR